MNAGVDDIYSHTILKCTFERNELDLSSFDYIHVSAERHSISIRNLVISHELIPEAHPKFDKTFVSRVTQTLKIQSIVLINILQKSSYFIIKLIHIHAVSLNYVVILTLCLIA
jgi:hypothetical protein